MFNVSIAAVSVVIHVFHLTVSVKKRPNAHMLRRESKLYDVTEGDIDAKYVIKAKFSC